MGRELVNTPAFLSCYQWGSRLLTERLGCCRIWRIKFEDRWQRIQSQEIRRLTLAGTLSSWSSSQVLVGHFPLHPIRSFRTHPTRDGLSWPGGSGVWRGQSASPIQVSLHSPPGSGTISGRSILARSDAGMGGAAPTGTRRFGINPGDEGKAASPVAGKRGPNRVLGSR